MVDEVSPILHRVSLRGREGAEVHGLDQQHHDHDTEECAVGDYQ